MHCRAHSSGCIRELGDPGQIIEANHAFLQMVGYDREDPVLGRIGWTTPHQRVARKLPRDG
jgi:PAS domain-containing protein